MESGSFCSSLQSVKSSSVKLDCKISVPSFSASSTKLSHPSKFRILRELTLQMESGSFFNFLWPLKFNTSKDCKLSPNFFGSSTKFSQPSNIVFDWRSQKLKLEYVVNGLGKLFQLFASRQV
ncbi:hypothetical protein GOP47_0017337 [Adiantum capillus-veneris]|uniref:Uncharacterized protein n=1 Tax=Adiantum capillus-veneris TaxID=13818 RepID=A0A9D4UG83_ADICA|nr:hypothetical protein GOP47_0017337 [Adiantum capillus-veneris]